jgi:uncharacterized protein YbaP (TraB family)
MRAALLALFACLLITGCKQQKPELPYGKPALWVVEDNSGATAGWLFGTIHALPDGARWTTPAIERAIDAAGVLVVEVRDLDSKRIAAEFDRLARDRPAPPLAERLAPGARDELAELLEREGTSARQFDTLETWGAALALAQLGDAVEQDNGTDKAMIASFTDRPVIELEGAADQLAIFDALPERDQRKLLAAVIAEQVRAGAAAEALARAWLAGDTATIDRLTRDGLLADPALYEVLLAKRNRAWATDILAILSQGRRPLVAVGAAHLIGRDGLPALLAAEGYTVRRIQ